jgi:segregation and condensation protein B
MPNDSDAVNQSSVAGNPATLSLAARLEAALFWSAGALRVKQLAEATGESREAVEAALAELAAGLGGRGVTLVRAGDEAALVTAPGAAETVAKMRRDELDRELTKAAAETLAAVAYAGPISRAELEHLRGVNCAAALRALSARGLVEREGGEEASRGRYRATVELLASMGVADAAALPSYGDTRRELEEALARATEADAAAVTPAP